MASAATQMKAASETAPDEIRFRCVMASRRTELDANCLSNSIELGFGRAGWVARKTPSAHVNGVRPSASLTSISGALLNEVANDVVRASVRRAVHRRQPHRVDRVDVHAELDAQLDRLEQRRLTLVEGLIEDPVHAGRRHQRGRAGERRDVRVGSVLEEQLHHREITSQCGGQERRLSGEVHPRERSGDAQEVASNRRHFLHAGVDVGASFEQHLNQIEIRRAIDAVDERGVVHVHVACLDRGPQRRPAVPVHRLDVRATVDQEPRDIRMVVGDRDDERRDVVGIALVDVGSRVEQHAGDVHAAVTRRVEQRGHPARDRRARSARRQSAPHDPDAVSEARHRVREESTAGRGRFSSSR